MPNDVVGKVLGPKHSGRLRFLRLGAEINRGFKQDRPHFCCTSASSSGGSCLFQCRENFAQMMNCHNQLISSLKTDMIMKEGTIPEQFVGLFDSPSMVSPTTVSKVLFTFFFSIESVMKIFCIFMLFLNWFLQLFLIRLEVFLVMFSGLFCFLPFAIVECLLSNYLSCILLYPSVPCCC